MHIFRLTHLLCHPPLLRCHLLPVLVGFIHRSSLFYRQTLCLAEEEPEEDEVSSDDDDVDYIVLPSNLSERNGVGKLHVSLATQGRE